MLDQEEALALALAFCRERVRSWEAYGLRLAPAKGITVPGAYAFDITREPDPDPRRPRIGLGGNYPVIVDRSSGACRFVAGRVEYEQLWQAGRR
ncbi:hypothetical protein ACFW1A_26660 [Kitasatospora sp. NPDC058965]|uniref:hypothetical protein n=1 Tax=Kitasatospora sp. NPDC058965 TaxID=3346682 RepID=UPI0036984086